MGRSGVTPLAVLALSLLGERPMHPYEMLQTMRIRRDDRLVRLAPGSLYHTVDRLARHGLVEEEGTDRGGNRPERTTYRITDAGRAALADAISDLVVVPEPEYPGLPVGLSELDNLPASEAAEMLERRAESVQLDEEEYHAIAGILDARGLDRHHRIDLDYLAAMAAAERAWLLATAHDIRSGDLEWPEPPTKEFS